MLCFETIALVYHLLVAGAWATVRPSIEWVIAALLTRVGALSRVCAVGGVVSSACPTDTCVYHQA